MIKASDPPAHSQRYTDALSWAAELHRRQWRKGKPVPYISHLIAVSALVWEDGGDEDQAIAALLHDAIEDAGDSQEQIRQRFGRRVAQIVADCTDTSGAVEPGADKEPWLQRKTRYIHHIQTTHLDSLRVSSAGKHPRPLVVAGAIEQSIQPSLAADPAELTIRHQTRIGLGNLRPPARSPQRHG